MQRRGQALFLMFEFAQALQTACMVYYPIVPLYQYIDTVDALKMNRTGSLGRRR